MVKFVEEEAVPGSRSRGAVERTGAWSPRPREVFDPTKLQQSRCRSRILEIPTKETETNRRNVSLEVKLEDGRLAFPLEPTKPLY